MGLSFVQPSAGGGSEGVTIHNDLTGRDASAAHPVAAIDGLETSLADLASRFVPHRAFFDADLTGDQLDLDSFRDLAGGVLGFQFTDPATVNLWIDVNEVSDPTETVEGCAPTTFINYSAEPLSLKAAGTTGGIETSAEAPTFDSITLAQNERVTMINLRVNPDEITAWPYYGWNILNRITPV